MASLPRIWTLTWLIRTQLSMVYSAIFFRLRWDLHSQILFVFSLSRGLKLSDSLLDRLKDFFSIFPLLHFHVIWLDFIELSSITFFFLEKKKTQNKLIWKKRNQQIETLLILWCYLRKTKQKGFTLSCCNFTFHGIDLNNWFGVHADICVLHFLRCTDSVFFSFFSSNHYYFSILVYCVYCYCQLCIQLFFFVLFFFCLPYHFVIYNSK